MFQKNLQLLRKAKGLSQEELASHIHVVRQTVSKWEKGLSVPDADLLIRLAEALDTTVSTLLGNTVTPEEPSELQQLAERLAFLNDQMAQQKERSRRLWRAVSLLTAALALAGLFFEGRALLHYREAANAIGGFDGPTAIFVTAATWRSGRLVLAGVILLLSAAGICKTGKR